MTKEYEATLALQLATVTAFREPFDKWAAANNYVTRWQEKVKVGDQYISRSPAGQIVLHVCGYISPFTQRVSTVDPWGVEQPSTKCIKVVPTPAINALTLDEKLTLLDQKLDMILAKLK